MDKIEPMSLPGSTYRLQFHREFTFAQATGILDYLSRLGISHVYASPYFQASESSTHGYDVADHNRISPAIGNESEYSTYIAGLRMRGLGQILDFVPNHMGISQPLNRWWMDVLENGPASLYADHFDIDWHPIKEELENKVLLPMLGDRYGQVLERAEFKLSVENGALFLNYYEAKLPLNPRSYPLILDRAAARLTGQEETDYCQELLSISTAFNQIPHRSVSCPDAIRIRAREKEVGKRRLARLLKAEPEAARALDETLRAMEGEPGNPASFDAMHELLCAQVYRLAYWRVAGEEINYRRFFDVNTLAAIRTELPAVFEAAHHLVFNMIERGEVNGLRIDHIDGLWNPRAYLEDLQKRFVKPDGSGSQRPLFLVVEKILAHDEWLPTDWPVHGTTGYEFGSDLGQLLVDSSSEQSITETYTRYGGPDTIEELTYEKKLLVTRMALAGEIAQLGNMLNRLSERDRHYRDFTLNQLTAAIRETIACLPVYRSYISPDRPVRDEDRLLVLKTVRKARQRNPSIDKPIFDYLAKVLLLEFKDDPDEQKAAESIRFALKFQQCSGPIMAKGLEDTTFYIYNRLAALNEVGGDPGLFGMSIAEFHGRCGIRLERCPHTLLATSTHDTKRSEDVRARLLVISELPADWRSLLAKWSEANAEWKTEIEGRTAPSPNEEYLLYQTLLGAWPLEELTEETRPPFIARIQEYMMKALKEAKVNSSWIDPNEEWENATKAFIAAIVDPVRGKRFLKTFLPFAKKIAELGMTNSLTQTILKSTTPGVPDFYQGCEVWDFSLVDPDNRRPVDYAHRQNLLESLLTKNPTPKQLVAEWHTGQIKMFVIQRLLQLRHQLPALFGRGSYQPLVTAGKHAQRVVAFQRDHDNESVVVVVPRIAAPLGFAPCGKVWGDTVINGLEGEWTDLFSGATFKFTGPAKLADLLTDFPAVCLRRNR